ncbi:MAG: ABC transporter substrate-binding protein, partial [Bifidobacterium crudilactis]|nr:ABC transporter substrate-binding protein [Bifidobacterium crudilactis]
MKAMFKKALAAAGAGVSLTSLAACGGSADSSSSAAGPKIKIGIKFAQPGLGYKQGRPDTGFDVAVGKYV